MLIGIMGTSLVVQCLRLCAPNAEDPGSIPGQGTRSHRLQLRLCRPQLKILQAEAEEMKQYAIEHQNMKTLKKAAISLVEQGITTMEELERIAYYDD